MKERGKFLGSLTFLTLRGRARALFLEREREREKERHVERCTTILRKPVKRVHVLRPPTAQQSRVQSHSRHVASALPGGVGKSRVLFRLLERTKHTLATHHRPRRHIPNAHRVQTERRRFEVLEPSEQRKQRGDEEEQKRRVRSREV